MDGGQYTVEEVARLLDVPVKTVRAYLKAGFVAPAEDGAGGLRLTFQDVVLLRTAQGLLDARIAPGRIKRALTRLGQQLPRGRPLTGVAIGAEGNRVVVRDGGTRWNPESGQILFDFHVDDLSARAAALGSSVTALAGRRTRAATPPPVEAADDWFEVGCRREDEGDLDGALASYRQALNVDEEHVEAHINLGRLLQQRGGLDEAVAHYRKALALRPEEPLTSFNLGVALEDQGRWAQALEAYRTALVADPRYADAHYNLSGVYERLGDRAAALRHLSAYKRLKGR